MRSRTLFRVLLLIVLGLIGFVSAMVFLNARHVSYDIALVIGCAVASGVLFTLSVVVGASFVGAEWNSGSMSTLLTWEPRRARVLAAKLVACMITTMVVSLVLLVVLALLLLPSAAAHGTTNGVPWLSFAGVWLRIGIVSAIGVALGVGLANVMRGAAGPIATWLIFQFVASPALLLWKRWLVRWLPDGVIRQFVSLEGAIRGSIGDAPFRFGGNVLRGGLVLGVYAAAFLGAGFLAFRARDVT
jgi:ABC-type transport system involved in multi-copper enzyme maturation permease subunit